MMTITSKPSITTASAANERADETARERSRVSVDSPGGATQGEAATHQHAAEGDHVADSEEGSSSSSPSGPFSSGSSSKSS